MRRLKLMPLSLLCIALTACAASPMQSPTLTAPSIAPTQLAASEQVKVTIQCGEHEPDQSLPPLPSPVLPLVTVSAWQAYFTSLAEWAAKVAGAFQAEKILRHNTALCLDQLRAKGLIN